MEIWLREANDFKGLSGWPDSVPEAVESLRQALESKLKLCRQRKKPGKIRALVG
jgi:hypothetical protein